MKFPLNMFMYHHLNELKLPRDAHFKLYSDDSDKIFRSSSSIEIEAYYFR